MRFLILGAGGIGGYFGGMAAFAGQDVTFLVRERRAQSLRRQAMTILMPDTRRVEIEPVLLVDNAPAAPFDVVVLSCKAYDLDSALNAIEPRLSPHTVVLPLLNGLAHYAAIDERLSAERVLGGFAQIGVTLRADGMIQRMSEGASIILGSRHPAVTDIATRSIARALSNDYAEAKVSPNLAAETWAKFAYLGALAVSTCLLRGAVAEIQATDHGKSLLAAIFQEICSIAAAEGFPLDERWVSERRRLFETISLSESSSMYRDLLAGNQVESDHIIGDLLRRAEASGVATPYVAAAYCQLQVYENSRAVKRNASSSA
jgi:2-dehydropantoate 2-reductase